MPIGDSENASSEIPDNDPRRVTIISDTNGRVLVVADGEIPPDFLRSMMEQFQRTHQLAMDAVAHDPLTDSLARFQVNETGTRAEGKTRLHYSDWSSAWLHGADELLPIGLLCEQLWGEGDSLRSIEKLRFRSPVNSELDLIASTDPLPDDKRAAIIGSLRSVHGKTVHFQGIPNGEPVQYRGASNPIANSTYPQKMVLWPWGRKKAGWKTRPLPKDAVESLRDEDHPGYRMQTFTDMATHAIQVARLKKFREQPETALISGYSDLVIPSLYDMARGGLRLQAVPDWKAAKQGKSGFWTVPVHVSLRDGRKEVGGGTVFSAYTYDRAVANKV